MKNETGQPSVVTTRYASRPTADASPATRGVVFMITGIGVHDRPD
jgi:hypothetical protein